MNTLNDILEKVKRSGLMIVLGVFSFYFAINAIKGDRGFFKYLYLKGKVEAAQAERERYAAIKKDLEHKVAMLSERSLDLDYLEERARIVLNMVSGRSRFWRECLNMVSDGEYVILDKDIDKK